MTESQEIKALYKIHLYNYFIGLVMSNAEACQDLGYDVKADNAHHKRLLAAILRVASTMSDAELQADRISGFITSTKRAEEYLKENFSHVEPYKPVKLPLDKEDEIANSYK